MAAQAGIEAVLNALVAKLASGMPARLAAIQAECGDGIALDVPPGYSISTRAEIPGWPWVMVLPDVSGLETDPGQYLIRQHFVWAVTFCQDYDENTLALKLLRTQRAVSEVLVANRRPAAQGDPSGYSLGWLRDEYGPVFLADEHGFYYQAVRSRFMVRQEQLV